MTNGHKVEHATLKLTGNCRRIKGLLNALQTQISTAAISAITENLGAQSFIPLSGSTASHVAFFYDGITSSQLGRTVDGYGCDGDENKIIRSIVRRKT